MAQLESIIFITGGVRSGKSSFAEKLAADIWKKGPSGKLHYIAAMQPSDTEMQKRIKRHQEGRNQSGLEWKTWEKPVSIGELAEVFERNDVVLLDCLTTWLNNELFFEEDRWQKEEYLADLFGVMWEGIVQIAEKVRTLVIVSNEVLNEPVADNELVLQYSRMLGKLHQEIVSSAQNAYLVEMGIPIDMKGVVK
ncbi:bifunctional adenosylcobinamide kinase/adenosylcobinamide-phosphate guanylyltransferase [Bacillus tuaregi]|uniref:bifunctional adenosylcobinamide kinase/adenosylcobinamide-phosphate guanylyltransferase n=1 Tax=Bacillus tuaregi TaxID=1816695 RepID=UPI0008F8E976|nr:bifunctional adenosylcobinamide kinase/adenosylcobinamide-phosphate guanylyltransferase [Bacillus tuaregi]